MATTADLFGRFDRRITATESEKDAALQRAIDCATALRNAYSPDEKVTSVMTLLGSAAKQTACTPLADVDVLFHMPAGTYSRYDDYSGNGQSALLQNVRDVLRRRYPGTDIRGDGPVVVVAFTAGANVEVVPGVLFDEGSDLLQAACKVPVTRDGGSWESSDYGAEYRALSAVDTPRQGQVKRLIRYMKAWRNAQNLTYESLVIELMAVEFAKTWPADRSSYTYDDWLVRDFLKYAADNYFTTYLMPGTGKRIDTGYGWRDAATRSHQKAVLACTFGVQSPLYVSYWQEVLGHGFGS